MANVDLAVTVTDDDTAGITVSVTQLTVTEAAGTGRTATYTVKLNTQPTGDVTITPSSSAESAATVSGALTFTSSNWSTAQTVTVTGVDDAVDQGDTDRTATISHTVSGGDYGEVSAGSVSVSVTDDDTAGITVTAADPFTVGEGGSATYTVKLNTQPSSDVVISLTVSGSSEVTIADTDGETTGVQNTLTFTSTDWSTAQTVTVEAAQDDDAVNDAATIAHAVVDASSAGEYDPVANEDLAVAVTDDDTAGVTVTAADPFTVGEGSSATYTVKLDTEPSSDVAIEITSTNAEVTIADTDGETAGVQNTLTFTSSDWDTPQTVTVNAAEDDDAVDDAATIAHAVVDASSADEYDPVANVDLAVAVTDDDTAGITITAADPFTVGEGSSATYTVKLDAQPSSDVVISLTVSGSSEVTIADTDTVMTGVQNTLTFTSANWSTAQTVTVEAAQDDDAVNDAATIAHAVVDASSADEYDPVANVDLAVTVTDNDTAGITLSALAAITEGSSATYTVKLDTQPSSDVVISLTVSGSSEVTVADTDTVMTGVQNTLTFTSTDWSMAQTVTVNAGEDDDAVNDAASIAHAVVDASSADEYDPVANVDLAVTVTDNDTAGITITAASPFTVGEGGMATYTVKLNSEPSSDVAISLTVSGSSEVTIADTDGNAMGVQNTLTFTSANWDTPQTVNVNAGEDDDAVNDAAVIAHAVVDASSADEYDPVANVDLAVAVTDDDTAGITVSVTQLTVTEAAGAGRTATYTVKLNTQPTGDVTITPSSSAESAATVSGALTFTTANWSTAQTVTVTGVDDDVDQGGTDRTATVSHTVSGGDYGDVSAGSVSVTVTDDDTAGITITAADPFTVGEGGMATYTVKLDTQPSSDVVISLTVSGSSEVTIADTDGETAGVQNTLTFTSSDWSTAQTVTVNAGEDDDAVNDAASIAHAVVDGSSADEYDPVANEDLAVTVTDDDTAGITVTAASPFTVGEGGSATYTVELDSEPSSDVVISLTVSGSSEVTVADTDGETAGVQNTLTFTSSNWSTAQTVTVNAGEDDDAVNDAATIAHAVVDASSAAEYDPVANGDLAVTVTDDDTAGITVTAADPFTVGEGASATYTVKLNTQPSSDVVISLTVSGSSEVTVADTDTVMTGVQNTLTFTSSDWSTAQTVTVEAAQDDDAVNDAAVIAHAVVDAIQRGRVRPGGQRGPGRHGNRRRHGGHHRHRRRPLHRGGGSQRHLHGEAQHPALLRRRHQPDRLGQFGGHEVTVMPTPTFTSSDGAGAVQNTTLTFTLWWTSDWSTRWRTDGDR